MIDSAADRLGLPLLCQCIAGITQDSASPAAACTLPATFANATAYPPPHALHAIGHPRRDPYRRTRRCLMRRLGPPAVRPLPAPAAPYCGKRHCDASAPDARAWRGQPRHRMRGDVRPSQHSRDKAPGHKPSGAWFAWPLAASHRNGVGAGGLVAAAVRGWSPHTRSLPLPACCTHRRARCVRGMSLTEGCALLCAPSGAGAAPGWRPFMCGPPMPAAHIPQRKSRPVKRALPAPPPPPPPPLLPVCSSASVRARHTPLRRPSRGPAAACSGAVGAAEETTLILCPTHCMQPGSRACYKNTAPAQAAPAHKRTAPNPQGWPTLVSPRPPFISTTACRRRLLPGRALMCCRARCTPFDPAFTRPPAPRTLTRYPLLLAHDSTLGGCQVRQRPRARPAFSPAPLQCLVAAAPSARQPAHAAPQHNSGWAPHGLGQ
jgi:hypothetical protein